MGVCCWKRGEVCCGLKVAIIQGRHMGQMMGSLKSPCPCTTSYRSLIETIALVA